MGKASKDRPGVIIKFKWEKSIDRLNDDAAGKFLKACLQRGKNRTYAPDFSCVTDMYQLATLETLYDEASADIDDDGDTWGRKASSDYANYCKKCKQLGDDPMSYTDFNDWKLTMHERDPEGLAI